MVRVVAAPEIQTPHAFVVQQPPQRPRRQRRAGRQRLARLVGLPLAADGEQFDLVSAARIDGILRCRGDAFTVSSIGLIIALIVAGGATFAAFPAWYSTMFSGFYVALLLVLVFLIIRVVSFASLTGKPMSIETAENLLRDVLHEESRFTLTIEAIQKRVAEHFDLRLADMTSKRRPENIAFPRQIAMFLSRQMTESSLNTIGEAFGGRDHGTVLHACRLVKDRMEVDSGVRQTVMLLEKKLRR